jgi:chemotaxis signal transduction protein
VSGPASGFLLVRVGERRVGLQLAHVVEVTHLSEVPLVHLGSLLDHKSCPPGSGTIGVVVILTGRRVCLEVDDAEVLVREPVLPVPPGEALPWAVGVARYGDGLVPLLDLAALSSRFTEAAVT